MGGLSDAPRPDGARRIAVTGAAGFVGRACVAEARRQGLGVVALCRGKTRPEWRDDGGIETVFVDLAAKDALPVLRGVLGDCAAVIHAAAHLGDDPALLLRDTLAATRTLLEASDGAARLVLVSSIAVYDTDALRPGDSLTEASPLIALPGAATGNTAAAAIGTARDAYAGAKRLQEALVTERQGRAAWILRPGAIWGPGRTWHALQGFWLGKLHVTLGSRGHLPLAHVDQVARAAVAAAQAPEGPGAVVNVLDDDLPTRARFLRVHRRCHGWPRLNVTLPYGLWLALIRVVKPVSGRLPGLFREPVLRARMMPLRFPNTAMRGALGGADSDSFEAMMARTARAR